MSPKTDKDGKSGLGRRCRNVWSRESKRHCGTLSDSSKVDAENPAANLGETQVEAWRSKGHRRAGSKIGGSRSHGLAAYYLV